MNDDPNSIEHTQAPSHTYQCPKCNYDLAGIDLSGNCPECGTKLIESCIWCEYDLSNTTPESPCPECGVPALTSLGRDAFSNIPLGDLRSIHRGFRMVTYGILLYILSLLASFFGISSFAFVSSFDENTIRFFVIAFSFVTNGLILLICFGWFKLSAPMSSLPEAVQGNDRRAFLRASLWVFTILAALWFLYSVASSIAWRENDSELSILEIAVLTVWGIQIVALVTLYIAQLRYLNWFAKLLRNRKMRRRSVHMLWSGPLIAIVGAFILMLGPLIVLVLYWNMVEYLRRDLSKTIKLRSEQAVKGS